jgi:hypothetical protein
MTVLAALSHEFGHVRWADITVPLRGPPAKPAGGPYSLAPLHSCDGSPSDFFVGWSYRNDHQLFPKDRWRQFNDRKSDDHGHTIDHVSVPLISQFLSGIPADQKNDLFVSLFQGDAPFASFFGSLAPDEDFVEAYVLGVLTAATPPLTSLPVTLIYSNKTTKSVDVPNTLNSRPTLLNKIACIP